jgi:hypothetical protein
MRNWIAKNILLITGATAGAIAGFLYWKYIGCVTGSCAITSDPFRSTAYFALTGALLFSFFKKVRVKNALAKRQDDPLKK